MPASVRLASKADASRTTRRSWSTDATGALLIAAVLQFAACSTADPMAGVRGAFDAGAYAQARQMLLELRTDDPGNAHVYDLEDGIAALTVGTPDEAEAALLRARDHLDQLSAPNAIDWFGAVMLDDRQLDYAGADYEKVLVRAVLALANLMRDGSDAAAYGVQVLEKQKELIDSYEDPQGRRPKADYKLVAFGSYLRGIIAEEDPFRAGVAREAFATVVEIEPGFGPGRDDLERATDGVHAQPGNGVVHVLAMVGRGPLRVEVEDIATEQILALAQIIWATIRERVTFPNISAVRIPALAFYDDNPTEVHVDVDGRPAGSTAMVTDVEATAAREFAAMHDQIAARAVLRRAFKIVVTEGVKEVVNRKQRRHDGYGDYKSAEPLTDLLISLGGLVWTALEHADLRCWSLLPASFQALRLEVPEGAHTLALTAGVGGRSTSAPRTVRVRVRAGFNTYVLAIFPHRDGGPPPLTSDAAVDEHPPEPENRQ